MFLTACLGFRFDTVQLNCNPGYCDCNKDKFTPICGQDGKTYLSPCHAGCLNYTEKGGKVAMYSECMCLNMTLASNTSFDSNQLYGNATIGYCEQDCDTFILYIILFSIFVFIHSTGEVGSMLLILRCVDPRDKAMALGLIQFAIGLFGNVPCPIVYGAVVDSACLVWKMSCGEKGACGLYDSDVFRMFYHGKYYYFNTLYQLNEPYYKFFDDFLHSYKLTVFIYRLITYFYYKYGCSYSKNKRTNNKSSFILIYRRNMFSLIG